MFPRHPDASETSPDVSKDTSIETTKNHYFLRCFSLSNASNRNSKPNYLVYFMYLYLFLTQLHTQTTTMARFLDLDADLSGDDHEEEECNSQDSHPSFINDDDSEEHESEEEGGGFIREDATNERDDTPPTPTQPLHEPHFKRIRKRSRAAEVPPVQVEVVEVQSEDEVVEVVPVQKKRGGARKGAGRPRKDAPPRAQQAAEDDVGQDGPGADTYYGKRWCFTLFYYETREPLWVPLKFDRNTMVCLVYQPETCPDSGKPHIQGFIHTKKKMRLKGIKKLIGCTWVKMIRSSENSSDEDNKNYCSKDESRTPGKDAKYTMMEGDFGSFKGKRNDILLVTDALLAGRTRRDIAMDESLRVTWIRHRTGFIGWEGDIAEERHERPRVVVLWGVTGSGKTTRARELMEEVGGPWYVKPKNEKWWDHYKCGMNVIIDEFSKAYGDIDWLKLLIGDLPFIVECKGGSTQLNCKLIVITSNIRPEEWYETEKSQHINAIMRKLTTAPNEIIHMATPWVAPPPPPPPVVEEEEVVVVLEEGPLPAAAPAAPAAPATAQAVIEEWEGYTLPDTHPIDPMGSFENYEDWFNDL